LHGTNAGTHLALFLTCAADVDIGKDFWQRGLLGGYPTGYGAHGTKGAPGARSVDKGKDDAYNGCHDDDVPEHSTYISPTTSETQLNAKHGKDKEHHEQTEAEGTYKTRNGTVRRILGQQPIVHVTTRTDIPTPIAPTPDAGQHRAYHTNESKESDDRIEPPDDNVSKYYPIEREPLGLIMTMKVFLLLCHVSNKRLIQMIVA